jgi:hypothetical protein
MGGVVRGILRCAQDDNGSVRAGTLRQYGGTEWREAHVAGGRGGKEVAPG